MDPYRRFRRYRQLAVVGLIVTNLVAVGWYWGPFLHHVLTDHERLTAWIASYRTYVAMVFMVVQFVQVLIFFIPSEVIQFAGGYLFGTWHGLLFSSTEPCKSCQASAGESAARACKVSIGLSHSARIFS